MKKKKIIIFGCQQIAVDFIKFLTTLSDVEISLIVTYELPIDKTYGYESVLDKARTMNLQVESPQSINFRLLTEITKIKPDVIFSIYYRKIFPKELILIPPLGCINVHPSLLPAYRGPTPTAWAILNGEKTTGITLHYMDTGIDTGDILLQKEFEIFDNETGFELYTRAMGIGAKLLQDNFYNLIERKLIPRKQSGIGSYFGKFKAKHTIDWRQKAEAIRNTIRIYSKPYSPAESRLFNRYLLINKVSILSDDKYPMQGAGKIIDILDNAKLVISCADANLVLEDYEIVPSLTDTEKNIYLKIGNKLSS